MEPIIKLDNEEDSILPDITQYSRLIGKLLYLTHSCYDISFVVCRLSQYPSKPTNTHLQAAHRVLRYIKVTSALALYFNSNSKLQLTGFTNLD